MDFSKLKLPFSVLVVAVVIAAAGMFLLGQLSTSQPTPNPTPSPTPTPIPQTQEQGDWVTYRSEERSIEFEYPREYAEDETLMQRCGPRESNGKIVVEAGIFIEKINIGDATLQAYIQQFDGTDESPYPHIWIANKQEAVTMKNIQIEGSEETIQVTHLIDPWYIGSSNQLFGGAPTGMTVFARTRNNDAVIIRTHDHVTPCGVEGKNTFERIIDTMKISL